MPPIPTEALACSENDKSRSEYIKKLIQSPQPSEHSATKVNIPRTIVQFWDDLAKANFSHIVFDDNEACLFISNSFNEKYLAAFDKCYHPAMRCDYFRLCYLLQKGGFYIDADERYQGAEIDYFFENNQLKLQPLCYEVSSGQMIEPKRFIDNAESAPDWIFYFNNNPIVSPANHPVIGLALERTTDLLINSKSKLEIQSTTGPGNLTASVVYYFLSRMGGKDEDHLSIISDWERFSISPWPLSYRNDSRNWRIGAKPELVASTNKDKLKIT
jgi:mannosyltransferase OCH1-like enzyme